MEHTSGTWSGGRSEDVHASDHSHLEKFGFIILIDTAVEQMARSCRSATLHPGSTLVPIRKQSHTQHTTNMWVLPLLVRPNQHLPIPHTY